MFLNLTVCGERRAINFDKVFDFHPGDRGGTVLHFDASVSLCGSGHDHRRVTVDQEYDVICKHLAEAGGRG